MANVLGSAVVRLGLDAAEFTSGMSKAEYQMNQLAIRNVALGSAIGIKLADAVTFAAKALWDLTMGSIDAKAKLQDLSTQTGLAVETLSGLARVGKYSNTSLEEITGATSRLTRALSGTSEKTSGAGRALKALGLNYTEFKSLAVDEQMVKVAQAMAGFKDGNEKAAAAMLLFGRSGAGFLKFLKELGERGILVTKETAASALAAKEYQDNLVSMGLAIDDFKAKLGEDMLPTLLQFTQALLDGKEAFGSWSSALWNMGTWNPFKPFKDANIELPQVRQNLEKLRQELKDLQATPPVTGLALAPTMNAKRGEDIKVKKAEIEEEEKMEKYLVSRRKQSQQTKDALALGVGPTTTKLDSGTEVVELNAVITENARIRSQTQKILNVSGETEASRYLESLRKQLIATQDLSAAEKVRLAVREGLEGLTPEVKKEILGKADALDVARQKDDRKKMVEDYAKGAGALAQLEQDASDAAATATAKRMTDNLELLKQMDKINDSLREEIVLIGKTPLQRAEIEAVGITRKQIAPLEEKITNIGEGRNTSDFGPIIPEGTGADAIQTVTEYREQIAKYKEQIAVILRKAEEVTAQDFKESNEQQIKSNDLLREEISLLGKDAQARAEVQAARIEKQQVVPIQKKIDALVDTTGDEAEATRKGLQEQIKNLREEQSLIVSKASKESAAALVEGNKALSEEVAMLGMDAKARHAYNMELLDTAINQKLVEAASQEESADGAKRRKDIEDEINLLRERRGLEVKKFGKQEKVDLKTQADQISKTMSESIAEGILDGFREGQSLTDVFIRELKAQFAKTILAPIIEPVVKAGNEVISLFLKGLMSGMGGGAGAGGGGGTSFVEYGAEGGPATKGQPIIVGEKGFELFIPTSKSKAPYMIGLQGTELMVPSEPGFIIPHDKIKSGTSMPLKGFAAGGSVMGGKLNGERFLASKPERGDVSDSRGSNVTVIQNNQFGTNISRNELANAAKMAQEQAKSDILRSVRLGGAFARSGG